jgi:hypothetical protein
MAKRQDVGAALDAFLPEAGPAQRPAADRTATRRPKAPPRAPAASSSDGEALGPLTVHLNPVQRAELEAMAARDDRSLGWLIRAAVAEYLARH